MRNGRIQDSGGRPLGIFFRTDGGRFVAKCPVLGDFDAETPEELTAIVCNAEAERIAAALRSLSKLRQKRRNDKRIVHAPTHFQGFVLSSAAALRAWPLDVVMTIFFSYGPAALPAAFTSGLPPLDVLAFLSGTVPVQTRRTTWRVS